MGTDAEPSADGGCRSKRTTIIVVVVVLIAAAAIGVGWGVALSGNKSSSANGAITPSTPPSSAAPTFVNATSPGTPSLRPSTAPSDGDVITTTPGAPSLAPSTAPSEIFSNSTNTTNTTSTSVPAVTPSAAPPSESLDMNLQFDFLLEGLVDSSAANRTSGVVTIELNASWAPNGVRRFQELMAVDYFSGNRFFRVIPNFVAQFGLNSDPVVTSAWADDPIQDDAPVVGSNVRGTVTFAATNSPNTRTTQLFFNLRNNSALDELNFPPIGRIIRGMGLLNLINSQYGEDPNQFTIKRLGNSYLEENFPNLTYIVSATRANATRP